MTSTNIAVATSTASATATEVVMTAKLGGRYYIPAASLITSVAFYDAHTAGGTYHIACDSSGVALSQTVVAGRSYEIPESLAGCAGFKMVTNVVGTINVNLKSI